MIIKCKANGTFLKVDAVATRKPERDGAKNYVVRCHDVDFRTRILGLAEMMRDYEFVKEAK